MPVSPTPQRGAGPDYGPIMRLDDCVAAQQWIWEHGLLKDIIFYDCP